MFPKASVAISSRRYLWWIVRAVLPPIILAALVIMLLREPLTWWLHGEEIYDQEAVKEWIREARVITTLPDLTRGYLELADRRLQLLRQLSTASPPERGRVQVGLRDLLMPLKTKRAEIQEHLKALGNPPTKMYPGQLPLFPLIYRITVSFDAAWELAPIFWDSELPRQHSQFRELPREPVQAGAWVDVQYHLHAYLQRQFLERQETTRRLWLTALGFLFAVLAVAWIYVNERRERDRQRQRLLVQQEMTQPKNYAWKKSCGGRKLNANTRTPNGKTWN